MKTKPPLPAERPPACVRCTDAQIWWPSPASPSGYAPACPWCDADALCDVPEDGFDYDADTATERR